MPHPWSCPSSIVSRPLSNVRHVSSVSHITTCTRNIQGITPYYAKQLPQSRLSQFVKIIELHLQAF